MNTVRNESGVAVGVRGDGKGRTLKAQLSHRQARKKCITELPTDPGKETSYNRTCGKSVAWCDVVMCGVEERTEYQRMNARCYDVIE